MKRDFVELGEIVRVFFGQEFEAFGDSIEEIVKEYIILANDRVISNARKQIQQLLDGNDDEALNEKLTWLARGEFDPILWGETWRSFLTKLRDLLPEN